MKSSKPYRCHLKICVAGANPALETNALFDLTHVESEDSPINEFLLRLDGINKLSPKPTQFDPYLGQLVLLGVVAAVESFIRTLFRRIITFDAASRDLVSNREVSYGAALHLSDELLPEAILEKYSFISKKNVEDALRDLLGFRGALPSELEFAINDYVRVCQMRHCAVHRFGKLGVRNAIALGLADHKDMLEKPLKLNYEALQISIAIATGFVKTINNCLFCELLSRVPPGSWTGNFRKDKRLFMRYYSLFADTVGSKKSTIPHDLYRELQHEIKNWAENDVVS